MEHIPGHKNKAASCLFWLLFAAGKRNNNPLNDEPQVEVGQDCCPLCEVELTNTKALKHSDKHCIRIAKLMEDPRSRFHERDSYEYDDTGLLYHINRGNGKEYKATIIPKTLIKSVLQGMHIHFGHFGIGKTYSLIKRYCYWPKMKAHSGSCRQLLLVSKGEDAG